MGISVPTLAFDAGPEGIDLRPGGWIMVVVSGDDRENPTPASHSCLTVEDLQKMHRFEMSADEGCNVKPVSQTRGRLEIEHICPDGDGGWVTARWVMEAPSPEVLEITATAVVDDETKTLVMSGRWVQWGCGGFDAPFPNS